MLTVRQRYGQTDGQTDGRTDGRLTIAIQRFALRASRGKKRHTTINYTVIVSTKQLDHSRPTFYTKF